MKHPHKCTEPNCNAPAYVGFIRVECSREGCKHWDGTRATVEPRVGQIWRANNGLGLLYTVVDMADADWPVIQRSDGLRPPFNVPSEQFTNGTLTLVEDVGEETDFTRALSAKTGLKVTIRPPAGPLRNVPMTLPPTSPLLPSAPITPLATPVQVGQYWREKATVRLWRIAAHTAYGATANEVDPATGAPTGISGGFPRQSFTNGSLEHVPFPFTAKATQAPSATVQVGQVWRDSRLGRSHKVLSVHPRDVITRRLDTGSACMWSIDAFTDGTLELEAP